MTLLFITNLTRRSQHSISGWGHWHGIVTYQWEWSCMVVKVFCTCIWFLSIVMIIFSAHFTIAGRTHKWKKNLQMGCLWLSNSFWTHYTYTSYAMLSSGILWSIPRVTYYLLSIHASDVKYIWNNTYLNWGCRWKWRMIIATRWTFFSFIHTSLAKEMQLQIRLVAKSNANYARRTMGRLGVLPSSV